MRPPAFWNRPKPTLAAHLLGPLGALYDLAGRARRRGMTPVRVSVPVICVGNLTLGGAGKTPVALSLAGKILASGRDVHFLSRGYGGKQRGPLRVDPAKHRADQVGDEALLLARLAPCWLSADRPAGARAAIAAGAQLILMDDGFQNPSLHKDLSILVVDGPVGLGNGRVFPAGPLRESWRRGLARAQSVVLIGEDKTGMTARIGDKPVLRAQFQPGPEADSLRDRRLIAFAGIGRPDKFFSTLEEIGAQVVKTVPFADHHPYREREIKALIDQAKSEQATLVSTEKDKMRLPPSCLDEVLCLPVDLAWETTSDLDRLLAPYLTPTG